MKHLSKTIQTARSLKRYLKISFKNAHVKRIFNQEKEAIIFEIESKMLTLTSCMLQIIQKSHL